MTDYWIQMDEGLLHSRLVDRLRALGLDTDQVIGKLYRLWIATLRLERGGVIGDRSDAWIEEAVLWRGEPGAFAAVIREQHLDQDGRIRDWQAKYGQLELLRGQARDRMRAKRQRDRERDVTRTEDVTFDERSRDSGGDVQGTPLPSPLSSSSSTETTNGKDAGQERREQQLASWADCPSVVGLVRSSRRPGAVLAFLDNLLTGEMGETKRSREVIARAALDMAASNDPRGFTPQGFRIFCDTAEKGMTRTKGREVNRREETYIEAEDAARRAREAESVKPDTLLKQFADRDPERYAALRVEAEAQVDPAVKIGRNFLVKAKLVELVRAEVGDAA
jgi:hypothetical protein